MSTTRYFLDTEFIDDGKVIDLISIGIQCSDGRTLYLASVEFAPDRASTWVKTNVLPYLPPSGDPAWASRKDIAEAIQKFVLVDGSRIEFWGYYCDYDWVAFCQLFGSMVDLPAGFPKFCMDLKQWSVQLGSLPNPPKPENGHHALADAQWNERLYEKLRTIVSPALSYDW